MVEGEVKLERRLGQSAGPRPCTAAHQPRSRSGRLGKAMAAASGRARSGDEQWAVGSSSVEGAAWAAWARTWTPGRRGAPTKGGGLAVVRRWS